MKFKYTIYILLTFFIFIGCTPNENSLLSTPTNSEYVTDTLVSNVENPALSPSELLTSKDDINISKVDKIIQALPSIIGDYKDNIALYYYNFDSKEEYYFNEDVYYITASLKKVPLAMQVLDKVYTGEFTLDTEITYEDSDYSDGTGILQFEENIGSRTIEELIKLSMIESDNIAYNMLNRLCGKTLFQYIDDMLGDKSIVLTDDGLSYLTAKHNFEILYNLYTNPDNNPYYMSIIEHLKNTAFNDSLNKYLPKGTVSHKIGSYFRSYHDAGIIFSKETYILIVLTKDVGELTDTPEYTDSEEEINLIDWGKGAFELIATISKNIYDIIN